MFKIDLVQKYTVLVDKSHFYRKSFIIVVFWPSFTVWRFLEESLGHILINIFFFKLLINLDLQARLCVALKTWCGIMGGYNLPPPPG